MVILGVSIVTFIIVMTLLAPVIAPHNPEQINSANVAHPPSWKYLFGTNQLGQDILSRIMYGSRTMLEVGIFSVIICLAIGVPVGLSAGYVSGVPDRLASLVMDSIYAFPGLVLAIAISAVLGTGVVNLSIAISVVYIPSYFRVVRSQVLSIKHSPLCGSSQGRGRTD